jgi:hypothetical protein
MNHMKLSLVVVAIFLTAACEGGVTDLPQSATAPAADAQLLTPDAGVQAAALLPDLVTGVPSAVAVRGKGSAPRIFFTNRIANLGAGRFQVHPVHEGATTVAYQQLLDASDAVVSEFPVSTYEFHPDHGHWHIDAVAEYTVRSGALDGPIVSQSTKVTFCLIDTERLFKSGAGSRHYGACNADLQGITNGWADVYHSGLPGQSLSMAGAPAGVYYLISLTDPLNRFTEADDFNNEAWVSFQLSYVGGAPRLTLLDHSACSGRLCGGS